MTELDPRWEWEEVTTFGGETMYVKTACKHLEVVPVESIIGGDVLEVSRLCLTCDTQLSPKTEESR